MVLDNEYYTVSTPLPKTTFEANTHLPPLTLEAMNEARGQLAFTHVPDGLYTPSDLNLDMPEVKYVSVGKCICGDSWQWNELAHTTLFLFESGKAVICFRFGTYLFSSPNELDETFLHEYAHALTKYPFGHNDEWVQQCQRVGLNYPRVSVDYGYKSLAEVPYSKELINWKNPIHKQKVRSWFLKLRHRLFYPSGYGGKWKQAG